MGPCFPLELLNKGRSGLACKGSTNTNQAARSSRRGRVTAQWEGDFPGMAHQWVQGTRALIREMIMSLNDFPARDPFNCRCVCMNVSAGVSQPLPLGGLEVSLRS